MAYPWQERSGAFSPLKCGTLVLVVLPALWLALEASLGWLGVRALNEAIHQSGEWAVRLLLLTLGVTPLRRMTGWNRLILSRRILGVSVLAYAALHVILYIVQQKFDLVKVVSEIILRFYLAIGFIALAGLIALGATSTDAAVKRLGAERWNRLHRLVYVIAVLGLVHHFLQAKIDVSKPVFLTGLFLFLMGLRGVQRLGKPLSGHWIAGLALISGLGVALIEALWYAGATGVNPWSTLAYNLETDDGLRPALWVALSGIAVAVLKVVWDRAMPPPQPRRRPT